MEMDLLTVVLQQMNLTFLLVTIPKHLPSGYKHLASAIFFK
jgi:hypothetical protein